MKKVLVLFLTIAVVAGTSIGFGATLNSNTNDSGNTINTAANDGSNIDNSQNDGNSDNINQNRDDTDNSQGKNDGNNFDQDYGNNYHGNDKDNWYNGFWNKKDKGFDKCRDKDYDTLWNCHDTDECCDDDYYGCDGGDECYNANYINNQIAVNNDINNVNVNTASNAGTELASSSKASQIYSEIQEYSYKNRSVNELPMQKTGLPVVPALLSTLLVGSGLLYRKLRK
ncbi:hypothetical protein [Methanobacterium sp.]|uniref:hypothetical protein n=1 Tax=Methanobacterium sp. TaxID=2164 RepID=UPI0031588C4A